MVAVRLTEWCVDRKDFAGEKKFFFAKISPSSAMGLFGPIAMLAHLSDIRKD